MNKVVGERNKFELKVGKKWVTPEKLNKDLWKCIGCIILEVSYGKKGCRIWVK